jgi:hypothetical protein
MRMKNDVADSGQSRTVPCPVGAARNAPPSKLTAI